MGPQGRQRLLALVVPGKDPEEMPHREVLPVPLEAPTPDPDVAEADQGDQEKPEEVQRRVRPQGQVQELDQVQGGPGEEEGKAGAVPGLQESKAGEKSFFIFTFLFLFWGNCTVTQFMMKESP